MIRRRAALAVLLATMTLAGTAGATVVQTAAHADDAVGSAVTVSGTGPFSSLKITVSQTQGLIDQVVNVSWTGGTPTDNATSFLDNYLQIMQCWGDDPTGPEREQCEFGSFSGDTRGPNQQPTRQVYSGPATVDPLETYLPSADDPSPQVPFRSVTGVTVPGEDASQFYDQQSTNEIPFARTSPDGTGQVAFETLTAEEAPGLGCGTPVTVAGVTTGRPCWLVVVPRGDTEVNGQPASASFSHALITSPLSATNWSHRIVIPLNFLQLGQTCPIGSPEEPTDGQEAAEEAISRWQPALCTQNQTIYGYSEVSDQSARTRLLSSSPALDLVSSPIPPSRVPNGTTLLYAPITLSAGVIAFNVDVATNGEGTAAQLAATGRPLTTLNLTPRVVAKLITQSYRLAAPPYDPVVANAPADVFADPDFLADNPDDAGLFEFAADVLMPFPLSDVTAELWSWINSDPDARAFLDGKPDPYGMTVNPAYVGVTDNGVPSNFPKSDSYCQTTGLPAVNQAPVCTLDSRPYANDMHDAGRSASRGDNLARASWDPTARPPGFKKAPPQVTGNQSVMAFTDAATAARYSLPVAKLRNAAGVFVAPDTAGLLAGEAAMVPSGVPGVLSPNPESTSPAAYPLTTLTYAATAPVVLSSDDRTAYATFLHYAATTGQTPGLDIGELPYGYVPLPADLASETTKVATELQNGTYPIATPTTDPPSATPSPTTPPTTTGAEPTPGPTQGITTSTTVVPSPTKTTSTAPSQTGPATTSVVPAASSSLPGLVLPPGGGGHGFQTTGPPLPPVTPLSLESPQTAPTSPQQTPPPDPAITSAVTTSSPGSAAAAATPAGAQTPQTQVVAATTASVSAGAGRYVVLVLFMIGAVAALSGPTLSRLASRRSR